MTTSQVHVLFQDYVHAFVEQDIDRICAFWDYPALLVYQGKQMALDRDPFRANVVRLCAFYTVQGMKQADKRVVEFVPLTDTTAAVRTADILRSGDSSVIAAWEHAYLLSEAPGGVIKISAAMPDGEIRAWRQRGTPLLGE